MNIKEIVNAARNGDEKSIKILKQRIRVLLNYYYGKKVIPYSVYKEEEDITEDILIKIIYTDMKVNSLAQAVKYFIEGVKEEDNVSIDNSNIIITYDNTNYLYRNQLNKELVKILDNIPEKEKLILYYRFKYDMTYKEIGHKLGLSIERIRQMMEKALRRLRHPSNSKYIIDFIR